MLHPSVQEGDDNDGDDDGADINEDVGHINDDAQCCVGRWLG